MTGLSARAMRWLVPWSPHRVRTRLIAAFLLLFLAALSLSVVGWYGMRSTQRALAGIEEDVLPGIAHALELAERTAQLAAIAPHLADARTPETLRLRTGVVDTLLGEVRRLSSGLRPAGDVQAAVGRVVEGVGQELPLLVALTQQRQALQAAMQRRVSELDQVGAHLRAASAGAVATDPAILALWSSLVLGATTTSNAQLGELEADVEALLLAARRRNAVGLPGPGLEEVATGPESLLTLRRQLTELDNRTAYLIASTRTNADQLSEEVARHVATLRETAANRGQSVRSALRFGETGMLLLALVSLAIAAGAARYGAARTARCGAPQHDRCAGSVRRTRPPHAVEPAAAGDDRRAGDHPCRHEPAGTACGLPGGHHVGGTRAYRRAWAEWPRGHRLLGVRPRGAAGAGLAGL